MATEVEDLRGCEKALLSRRDDTTHAERVRTEAIGMLSKSRLELRHSLYWILAQLGGAKSLAALEQASATADDAEFGEIVKALSYSPDLGADEVLLSIIRENLDTPRAKVGAREGIRRMVIGAEGIGKPSGTARLDFADSLLRMELDRGVVMYLGHIQSGRCAKILQRCMRQGGMTSTAAKSIISATSDLKAAPAADRKLATAALIDTIEFIEVTQLRGGASERLKLDPEGYKAYPMWKALSAQAGKNLLKLDDPGKEPLPEFDDLDLDF